MFGYGPIEGSLLTWGCRAIYTGGVLDIVPNRHQFSDYSNKQLVKAMAREISATILPDIIKRFVPLMPSSSSESFLVTYDFPGGPGNDKLVAQGSPNSSYGYFYISVGLVTMADLPVEEEYPSRYKEMSLA